MKFRTIEASDIRENAVELFGKRWALLTAGPMENHNTMTVSWGALGELWNKPMITAYVRPVRYTFGFMEREDYFTLSFFGEEYRQQLAFCGAKSGRDVNKDEWCGITPLEHSTGCVYDEQAELVIVCRKLYSDNLRPENFEDEELCRRQMADTLHKFYYGEIIEVLTK